jgi:carboxypeptidase Q
MRKVFLALCSMVLALPLWAGELVDWEMASRIRLEGTKNSQVMDLARTMTDVLGPRLTNSPNMRKAEAWAKSTLEQWGLANVHLEGFEFGRGWYFTRSAVEMVAPTAAVLIAFPKAWTPGTGGRKVGQAVRVSLESEADFEKHKGKLAGKILLLDKAAKIEPPLEPLFKRYEEKDLEEVEHFPIRPPRAEEWREQAKKEYAFGEKRAAFLAEEGVLATVEVSSRDGGPVRVMGTRAYKPGFPQGVPGLVMAAEHYNRLVRLLEAGENVELAVEVEASFVDGDTKAYNVIAEIPGSDLKDQVVMAGAHFDSWHTGTGATDNAASCAVVMEAMRILKAVGAKPRRTIRMALWNSEEQGLNGSRAYVCEHFACFEPAEGEEALPEYLRERPGKFVKKRDFDKLAAYFNVDFGAGAIRGIYTQENLAVKPIFAAWMEPLADLGVRTVSVRAVGGTDHLSFDRVGLPGFQFIQDGLDYTTRTHHTHLDVYDRLQREDLVKNAIVLATFLYQAAMRPEPLPRKPLPETGK